MLEIERQIHSRRVPTPSKAPEAAPRVAVQHPVHQPSPRLLREINAIYAPVTPRPCRSTQAAHTAPVPRVDEPAASSGVRWNEKVEYNEYEEETCAIPVLICQTPQRETRQFLKKGAGKLAIDGTAQVQCRNDVLGERREGYGRTGLWGKAPTPVRPRVAQAAQGSTVHGRAGQRATQGAGLHDHRKEAALPEQSTPQSSAECTTYQAQSRMLRHSIRAAISQSSTAQQPPRSIYEQVLCTHPVRPSKSTRDKNTKRGSTPSRRVAAKPAASPVRLRCSRSAAAAPRPPRPAVRTPRGQQSTLSLSQRHGSVQLSHMLRSSARTPVGRHRSEVGWESPEDYLSYSTD
eukprot:TRINITY_DN13275_c0_g1_i1.p1 TRINITY_DN13275_c0_g1~~TRINITY_DN13275_c0_g1_i1.p1  ORF type:complete len:347 (-),score=45.85 TRINITY_DN13275_c0_g1_i1:250-1290(-)